MYLESDFLLLSGLQHLHFCPRQCALIHIEQLWNENYLTAKGRALHERVHSGLIESRKTVRIERDLKIFSANLGVVGRTDAVEFYKNGIIVPIEYKSGKPKEDTCDEVQLCAQVICLEEMLGVTIEKGALYYFKVKKRQPVLMTDALRSEVFELSKKYHLLVDEGITPKGVYTAKCKSCSFVDDCFADILEKRKSVKNYLQSYLF